MNKTPQLIIILASLYLLLGKVSFYFLAHESIVSIGMFPSEGFALAFVLYFGKRVIPGIFIGQFLLAFTNGLDILPALSIASTNSLEAFIGFYILERFHFQKEMNNFRDFALLFGVVIFVLQPFSALSGNSALLFFDYITQENFFYLTLSWWFGNVIGQFLFTPFLLMFFKSHKSKKILLEYLFLLLSVGVFFYALLIVDKLTNPFVLFNIILPVIIAVVVIKSIVHGAVLLISVSTLAAYSVHLDIGAFTVNSALDNIINYDLFVLSLIIIVYGVGVLFEQRKKQEVILQERVSTEVAKNREQELMILRQNRLAQIGEMITMIAHQWRQPLNNLSLVNQLVLSKYKKNRLDDEAMQYFQNNSATQIELMSKTIDDFRNFFIEKEEKEQFYLNDTIDDLLNLLNPRLKSLKIKVFFTHDANHSLYSYKNELAHAVMNILNNAQDALIENEVQEKKIFLNFRT